MSDLLDFYRGAGTDAAGRTIGELWSWDAKRLEMTHDFIQWLFPLPEPSRFSPGAPLLMPSDIAAFRSDKALQDRVRRSLDLMLAFYGLERRSNGIGRAARFAASAHWLQPLNHNHLRLTRIMLFLRHAGLAAEADALLACLLDIAAHEGKSSLSEQTLTFWRHTSET